MESTWVFTDEPPDDSGWYATLWCYGKALFSQHLNRALSNGNRDVIVIRPFNLTLFPS
jgi:hypothetical protein